MDKITPKLLSWASILEPGTRDQAMTTASMPFIHPHLALMPDAHLGLGATVGSVIPTLGAIIPLIPYLLSSGGPAFFGSLLVSLGALFGTAVQTAVVMVIYLEEAVERCLRIDHVGRVALADSAHDVFHHHHRAINDEAEVNRAEAHQIAAHLALDHARHGQFPQTILGQRLHAASDG